MGRDRAARPEADALRLFVAVDVSEEAADAVERAVEPWRKRISGARWVGRDRWHVTLKFLGRTWPRLLGFVEEGCRSAARSSGPFELATGGLGVFPGPSRARVLWAGVEDPSGGLAALAGEVEARLSSEFPTEKRRFSAHLTVARLNPPAPMREWASELEAARVDPVTFAVDRLILYRSHLSPRGARYEAVGEFPLRAP